MVAATAPLTTRDYIDDSPFSDLLPHGLILDEAQGIVLLSTPRWGKRSLALGCGWEIAPVNIEVADENVCLDLARRHEHLLKSLPVGAALQVGMTIAPASSAPAWERQRHALPSSPVVDAQRHAVASGMQHTGGRLRHVRTWMTLRLPIAGVDSAVPALLAAVTSLPADSGPGLAERLQGHLSSAVATLRTARDSSITTTLRAAGHGVRPLDAQGLATVLAQGVGDTPPAKLSPGVPLCEQILRVPALRQPEGWTFGDQRARVLSLHRAPPRTYPGILSAPRAPQGTEPLALWNAWDGPLTLVVNVAVLDQAAERASLRRKRMMAFIQRLNPLGDTSPEHAALKSELDTLLTTFFLTGGQLLWARVHVVAWGDGDLGLVTRAGRQLDLELIPETTLASTLFLQALPLGFDPTWPQERFLRRARRLPGGNVAHLLPLYGGFRGTATPSVLFLNQRGEEVGFDPFDSPTAPHMVVTGKSGAGKSFLMGHVCDQVLPLGARVVILDRLPSYQDLCAAWGGRYVEMDFNAPVCLNPFYGPLDSAHRAVLTAVLAEMASGGIETLNRETMGVLSEAVTYFARTWDNAQGEATLSLFVEGVLQTGCFAPNDARSRRLGKEVARRLAMFTGENAYGGFLDGHNTLALDATLTVVELSRLKEAPDLQGVLLLSLMHLLSIFYGDATRLHQQKYLITDEVWALLKNPATAGVMEEIARTYRKLRTCAIFLSQQGADFSTATGKVLKANVGSTLFLEQEASEVQVLKEVFELSDAEVDAFSQVHKHETWSSAFLRIPGGRGGIVRLVPDAYTHLLMGQDDATRRRRLQGGLAA